MKFKGKRGLLIKSLLVLSLIMPIMFIFFLGDVMLAKPVGVVLTFIPFAFFLWIYANTSYRIFNNTIYYRSGFLGGQIAIHTIKKVFKNKTLWSGLRPATAAGGLVIVYNSYDEIYFSPADKEAFLSELLRINNSIEVE